MVSPGASKGLLLRAIEPWRSGVRGLDRRVYAVVAVTMLTVASRMGIYAFLGIYYTTIVGLPLALVGIAFLVENVARGFVSPVAGALSDRYGRRVVMLVSAALTSVVLPLFLFVRDPLTLIAWSGAIGVTQGGLWPAAASLLIDLVPPGRRQTVLSLNYTAIAIGYTIGVLPAGFLIIYGYGVLAAAGAIGYLCALAIVLVALRKPLPPTGRPRAASLARDLQVAPRDPAFLALAGLAFVFPFGIGLIVSALAVYGAAAGLTESEIGIALAINGPLLAALAIPVNTRVERTGPYRFLGAAALFLSLSYMIAAIMPDLAGLALATIVFTAGELVFSAALPAAVAQLAPEGMRGAYQGAWGLVFAIASGSALFLSGLVEAVVGWRATWFVWAGVTAAAGMALALARVRLRRIADARAGPITGD